MTNRTNELLTAALDYASRGIAVFPCKPRGKEPAIPKEDGGNGYKDATTETATIRGWWVKYPNANIGIATEASGLVVPDIDVKVDKATGLPAKGLESWQALLPKIGGQIDTPTVATPTGGYHYYYRAPEGVDLKGGNNALGPGIDIKTYVLAPPSIHPNGKAYQWFEGYSLGDRPILPLPAPLVKMLERKQDNNSPRAVTGDALTQARELGEIAALLPRLAAWRVDDYDCYTIVGMICKEYGDPGFAVWDQWAQTSPKYDPARCLYQWGTFLPASEVKDRDPATIRTIRRWARDDAAEDETTETPDDDALPIEPRVDRALVRLVSDPVLLEQLATLPYTDPGNAEAFYTIHGGRFRHVRTRQDGGGYWLTWDTHLWREDKRGETARAALQTIRARQAAAKTIADDDARKAAEKAAHASENRYKLSAMLDMAREIIPSFATLPGDYDQDSWLLGCPNGILDLRTGELRAGRPDDNITLCTSVPFDPNATAPQWERFLSEVFNDDADLIRYVQKAAGYSLTGDTREPAVFLCHGKGRNGKSTLLNRLLALAGEYGCNTPFSTFEANQRGAIPNDVAALAGRRLVTAAETSEASQLNEARIKAMTGKDPITARFLHGEFFSFVPTFHIWLSMNHRPRVTGTDNGIWTRIKLIPFNVSFVGREDKTLDQKLDTELPGILNWAVLGCLLWQREGLRDPAAVRLATDDYRAEMDTVQSFAAECCILQPGAMTPAGDLLDAYRNWAKEGGYSERSLVRGRTWGDRLQALGCTSDRATVAGKQTRVWRGIGLIGAMQQAAFSQKDGIDTPSNVVYEDFQGGSVTSKPVSNLSNVCNLSKSLSNGHTTDVVELPQVSPQEVEEDAELF